jgi:hypothetical protein
MQKALAHLKRPTARSRFITFRSAPSKQRAVTSVTRKSAPALCFPVAAEWCFEQRPHAALAHLAISACCATRRQTCGFALARMYGSTERAFHRPALEQ